MTVTIAVSTSSCSLNRFEHDECTANTDCRSAFGFGSVCSAEGFCEDPAILPRCRETYPEDIFENREKYADAIVLGTLMDRSVPKKVARQRSARLAAVQMNEEGGLDGRRVGLVMCTIEENDAFDELNGEDAAIASAEYLTKQLGVPAIIGPSGSGNTTAVFQAVRDSGALVISPSATSPALTNLDHASVSDSEPGLLWRTAPPDSFQGKKIAEDALSRNIQSVAVLHQSDAYGEGLANVFNTALTAGGSEAYLVPWESDNQRTEAIIQVSTMPVQEVFFVASGQADIVAFLNAAATTPGYETKTVFLPDAGASQDMFTEATAASGLFDRIRGTRIKPLGDEFAYKAFVAGYQGEYADDVTAYSFTAQTYDAAWLTFYGSAWSMFRNGAVTGAGIGQGLRKVSCVSGSQATGCNQQPFDVIPSSWPGIVEQFRSGFAVELRGASGELDYNLATEETSAAIEVWIVNPDGTIQAAP